MTGAGYRCPTVEIGMFRHFDTGGRCWTPAWDYQNSLPRTVKEVRLKNGEWHAFDGFVSTAEATIFAITGQEPAS